MGLDPLYGHQVSVCFALVLHCYLFVCLFILGGADACVSWCMSGGGKRTAWGSQLFPSTVSPEARTHPIWLQAPLLTELSHQPLLLVLIQGNWWDLVALLTWSHLKYTSFIPSATGISNLIPNFLPATFTSGAISQPEEQKAGARQSAEKSVVINTNVYLQQRHDHKTELEEQPIATIPGKLNKLIINNTDKENGFIIFFKNQLNSFLGWYWLSF